MWGSSCRCPTSTPTGVVSQEWASETDEEEGSRDSVVTRTVRWNPKEKDLSAELPGRTLTPETSLSAPPTPRGRTPSTALHSAAGPRRCILDVPPRTPGPRKSRRGRVGHCRGWSMSRVRPRSVRPSRLLSVGAPTLNQDTDDNLQLTLRRPGGPGDPGMSRFRTHKGLSATGAPAPSIRYNLQYSWSPYKFLSLSFIYLYILI